MPIADLAALMNASSQNLSQVKGLTVAYNYLLGGVPTIDGYTALIEGNNSSNFGAGPGVTFNDENVYINVVNALYQGNATAKASFDAIVAGQASTVDKLSAVYDFVIPADARSDAGKAYFLSQADFFTARAAELGIAGANGAALVGLGGLAKIAVDNDIGGLGDSVNDFVASINDGSAAIPQDGSAFTPVEDADGANFDADDVNPLEVTLTEGIDIVTGNVFNAPRGFTPAGNDQVNTLNDDDVLTGTGTNPTLNFTFVNDADTGDTNIVPTLNGINTINVDVRSSTAAELDLQNSSGVQNINVTGLDDSQTFGFDNIQDAAGDGSGINIGINNLNDDDSRLNFLFDDDAVEGTADVANVNLNDGDLSVLQIEEEDATEGLETINLAVTGGSSSIDLTLAEDLQTLNVTGDQDIRLGSNTTVFAGGIPGAVVEAMVPLTAFGNVAGSFSNYNGSANTGNQTVHFGPEVVVNKDGTSGDPVDFTATGGTGDDTFRFLAGFGEDDTIDGGEGADTIGVYSSVADATVSNFESLEVRDTAGVNNTITVDTSIFAGLESILVRNEGNNQGNPGAPVAKVSTINLDDVSATVAGNGIDVLHGTTGNNAVGSLLLNVDLDDASGTSDTAVFDIMDGTNQNPRFNATLTVDGENAAGTEDAGAVENITINDMDSESNTILLANEAEHSGTITITGGSDGEFFNLDATANFMQVDQTGGSTDVAGFVEPGAGAAERLSSTTIDASGSVSDVYVRVDTLRDSTGVEQGTGGQTITMGEGDDYVIFDAIAGATQGTAGLTISDTVTGGDGDDTLGIDGNGAIVDIAASEWTNVSGFENIHLFGNGQADNNAQNMQNAYNLTLTDQLVDANGGDSIDIINDNGGAAGVPVDANDGVTITANGLSASNSFNYDGQEAAAFGPGGADDTVDTADRFILGDANVNGAAMIDGGAIVNEAVAGANIFTNAGTNDGTAANSDVLEIRDAAVVTVGDLANISNVGRIELTNDEAVDQNVTLQLDNATVDRLVNTSSAANGANTTTIGQTAEVLTITAFNSPSIAGVESILNLDASAVTNAALFLNVTGADDADTLVTGAGNDTITGAGGQDTITTGGGSDIVDITGDASVSGGGTTLATAAANTDIVTDFNFDLDRFDVDVVPPAVIAAAAGSIDAATFVANVDTLLTTAVANQVQIITANAGDLNGRSWLVQDTNGDGTLDAGEDLVEITGFTGTIDVGDFF